MAENEVALLIELPQAKAYEAFTQTEPVALHGLIDMVAAHVRGFPGGDVETPEGREAIRQFAFRVTKSKTFLETEGKRVADQVKALPKVVDANRRMMSEALERMRDDVRQPLTDWEDAEKARIDAHTYNVEVMIRASKETGTVTDLRAALAVVNAITISPESCEEFLESYQRAHAVAATYLTGKIAEQEKLEAERAELEVLRKEKAERDAADAARRAAEERKERESRIAQEAAETARKAAEDAAKRREDAIIREAEETQRRAVEEAERRARKEASERMPPVAPAPVERPASTPQRDMQASVNRAVVAALMSHAGLSEAAAKRIVTAIIKGDIPNLSITYGQQQEAA